MRYTTTKGVRLPRSIAWVILGTFIATTLALGFIAGRFLAIALGVPDPILFEVSGAFFAWVCIADE